MSQRLTDAEIQAQMAQVPDWAVEGDRLQRTYRFKDFVEAIAFVNKLVEPAEAAGHHPDIAISYNRVTVTLTTHDAGGLTQKDFDLAATLSKL
jgi:4a-hydroxytetrahydrobiopterin dehydratase